MEHIPDHDMERFYLRVVTDPEERDRIAGHLLICPKCARRAVETIKYIDAMRDGLRDGSFTE